MADYFVWEMSVRDRTVPIRQVNKHPLERMPAMQLARIGATEGKHDRSVTTSPKSKSFKVIAQYARGTGENVTAEVYKRRKKKEHPHVPIEPQGD